MLITLWWLHNASVESKLVTIALEVLCHPPLPVSLSSSPTILHQNPYGFRQTYQSQTESFPTKRLCVLVSSAASTFSTLLPLTPTHPSDLNSSQLPPTIPLSSPPPTIPKLNHAPLLFFLQLPFVTLTKINNYISICVSSFIHLPC